MEQVVKIGDAWYFGKVFRTGDVVKRVNKKTSYRYSGPSLGEEVVVTAIASGGYYGYVDAGQGRMVESWKQKILIKGYSSWYNSENFALVKGTKMNVAIEQDKPTYLRECIEVLSEGKTKVEYVGDWMPFDNLSSAKLYAQTQISNSIRESNVYRKFAIFQQIHVAQAKQPEIEFV